MEENEEFRILLQVEKELDEFYEHVKEMVDELKKEENKLRKNIHSLKTKMENSIYSILKSPIYHFVFKCQSSRYSYEIMDELFRIKRESNNMTSDLDSKVKKRLEEIFYYHGLSFQKDILDSLSESEYLPLKMSIYEKVSYIELMIMNINTEEIRYMIDDLINTFKNMLEKPDYKYLTRKYSYIFELIVLAVLATITFILLGKYPFFAIPMGMMILVVLAASVGIIQERLAIYFKYLLCDILPTINGGASTEGQEQAH